MAIFTNNGTAANPAITNTNDTNTGIFYPAADTVGISTGGVERIRVDNSGIVNYYNKTNILGTVSQSGGVPTGAIIESGSNANGSFVRYANGTQTCFGRALTLTFSTASRLNLTLNFPVSFSATPTVLIGYSEGDYLPPTYTELLNSELTNTTTVNLRARSNSNYVSGNTRVVNYTAIGRWY